MSSVRRLVSAVTADDLSTLDIRKVEVLSVINLWASAVTVTDTIGMSVGKIEIMPAATANVRAAAVGLVLATDDQLIFDSLVGEGVGDLKVAVATLTTSLIYILSVEPALEA
jgi:hypothetical protein